MAKVSSTGLDPAAFPARPAQNYAEAMTRIEALQALDGLEVRPDSGTRLWTHGAQTERAVVFYHGYTNAPPQYKLLAEQFYQACLLYTSPSPRDRTRSRMPSSA